MQTYTPQQINTVKTLQSFFFKDIQGKVRGLCFPIYILNNCDVNSEKNPGCQR